MIEKNDKLGAKLQITGKGRCNITNIEDDQRKMIGLYNPNGKFLYSSFNKFSNQDVITFFEDRKVKTKTERGGRVFPVSDNADDVVKCLQKYLKDSGVETKMNSSVYKIIVDDKKIEKVILENGEEVTADKYIIATGGKSYPATGSTGEAYKWLEKMGHTIIKPTPALTPIVVKEKLVKELEGLSLKNIEVSLWDKKKLDSFFGEAVFTGNGLSGPVVLNLSNTVSANSGKNLTLNIDFKPALDFPTLDKRILRDFDEQKNKQFRNSLDKLMPKKLIPVVIELSGIDPMKKVNEVSKDERKALVKILKEFELNVKGLVGFEKAIVTAGGVELTEIDPKTMQSKIISNLYLAGEIINLDGPTGGYNLQIAWSTGFTAGSSVQ